MRIPSPLVAVEWLAERLEQPNLVVLDASLKAVGTRPLNTPNSDIQIPASRTFDLDKDFSDLTSPLPHMMPGPDDFREKARTLGISRDSVIVVYDRSGLFSSPRVWWMFKAMGHAQVAVLDGGFPAWVEASLPCQAVAAATPMRGDFEAVLAPRYFCDAEGVIAALADANTAVLDARSTNRFAGKAPEPRKQVRSGHMPGAHNLPWQEVQVLGKMRSAKELKTLLQEKLEGASRLVVSCGSASDCLCPSPGCRTSRISRYHRLRWVLE